MTTEEKAKAYDEALKWMRELYPGLHGATKEDAEHYFPELAESEDERIRRELIDFIQWSEDRGMTRHDFHQAKRPLEWIAWLEKQKYDRMKPIYDAKESFESALEKAWNDYHNGYENVDKLEDDYVECAHAKGFREGYLFGIEKQKEQSPRGFIDDFPYSDEQKEQKPADVDESTKRLNENWMKQYFDEQKPDWSEEDEKMLTGIIARGSSQVPPYDPALREEQMEWLMNRLKSLRPCPSWKPSDHQMNILKAVKEYVGRGSGYWGEGLGSLIEDLEKLI